MTQPEAVADAAEPNTRPFKQVAGQGPLQSQPSAGTPQEEQAATKLQAAYRGHIERRSRSGMSLRKDPDKVRRGSRCVGLVGPTLRRHLLIMHAASSQMHLLNACSIQLFVPHDCAAGL